MHVNPNGLCLESENESCIKWFLVCTERFNFLPALAWISNWWGEWHQSMDVCACVSLFLLLLLLLLGPVGGCGCWLVLECCRYSVHKLRAILFRCGNKEHIYIDRNDRMRTSTTHIDTYTLLDWRTDEHIHQHTRPPSDESNVIELCRRLTRLGKKKSDKSCQYFRIHSVLFRSIYLALCLILSTNFLLLRPLHCFSSSNYSEWIQLKSAYELKALPNWI